MSENSVQPPNQRDRDFSKTKWAVWLPILISLSASAGGLISWLYSQSTAKDAIAIAKQNSDNEENKKLLASQLVPIQIRLKKSKSVYDQLSREHNLDGYGALESYVTKARKQGIEKLALSYALITDIAQLDAEISALLESYDPYHINEDFKKESDAFLEHAHTYVIRFKSLQSMISTNASLPSWKPFPEGLPSALDAEILARKALIKNTDKTIKTMRSFNITRRSGFRSRGHSNEEWCNNVISQMKIEYPDYDAKVVESHDFSHKRGLSQHVEYDHSCTLELKSK